MQKILIFTAQPTPGEGLKSLLEERGVQVKVVTDFGIATEWLSGRGYDILIVTEDLPEEQLRSLGAALWGKNSSAMAVVTSYDGELPRSPAHYRMFGYSPIPYRELVTTILELRSDGQADLQPDKFPVLVVEDLDSPRDIICIFIESLGFSEVHGVASASEALSLLERDPSHYSCVVTDIRMPKISGKEMTEIIRSHPKLLHLPIIVLTAYGTLDMLVDCLRAGASGFLVKPPKKDDMLRELSRAVRIHEKKENPRLASHQEAEYIRKMVEEQQVL